MVSVDKAVITRIKKGGMDFEILVDPDKALEFRKGKPYSVENILAVRGVFKDAKKGDRASDADLTKAFGTSDVLKVSERIIKEGEIQLTTEQRRKLVEEKRKQIVDLISKHGVDPKTKLPHPPTRIMNAMEQARVNIDPFKPAQEQMQEVLKKLQEILPISIERVEIAIKIPVQHAGRASSLIRNIAPIKSEEWRSDYWFALVEIPAGMQAEIYEKLNDLTAGEVEVKVVRRLEG